MDNSGAITAAEEIVEDEEVVEVLDEAEDEVGVDET